MNRQLNLSETVVSICDYLNGCKAAVTISIDELTRREIDAPGYWWADQQGGHFHKLLLFKERHPQLAITIAFTPKNRYGLSRVPYLMLAPNDKADILDEEEADIRNAPPYVKRWLTSIQLNYPWIEIANHGLTHSPDDSLDLNEHEFDANHNSLSLDPSWCRQRVRAIREALSSLSMDNSRIIGFRAPGFRWTDSLIDALAEKGFLYVFVKGFLHDLFQREARYVGNGRIFIEEFRVRPYWYATNQGSNMLFIPTTVHPWDPDYPSLYDYIVASGGVINFFYHLHERAYEALDERITYLEKTYGSQLWWTTCGDIARYWIKKEGTRILRVHEQEGSLYIHLQTDSQINFPTSLYVGINPADVVGVDYDGRMVKWAEKEDRILITANLLHGESVLQVKTKGSFHYRPVNRTSSPKRAKEIMSTWRQVANENRVLNGSIVAIFLATELAALISLLTFMNAGLLAFILSPALALAGALLFAFKTGSILPAMTITGMPKRRRYLFYATRLMLNPFRVGLVTYMAKVLKRLKSR